MNDSKTVTSLSGPSFLSELTDTSDAALARRRTHVLTFIALVVVLAAAAFIAWWWLIARWQATTDDAYTGADMAQIIVKKFFIS